MSVVAIASLTISQELPRREEEVVLLVAERLQKLAQMSRICWTVIWLESSH